MENNTILFLNLRFVFYLFCKIESNLKNNFFFMHSVLRFGVEEIFVEKIEPIRFFNLKKVLKKNKTNKLVKSMIINLT